MHDLNTYLLLYFPVNNSIRIKTAIAIGGRAAPIFLRNKREELVPWYFFWLLNKRTQLGLW